MTRGRQKNATLRNQLSIVNICLKGYGRLHMGLGAAQVGIKYRIMLEVVQDEVNWY